MYDHRKSRPLRNYKPIETITPQVEVHKLSTLIAFTSCHQYENQGLNDAVRNTWLPDALQEGFDYKFFHGKGASEKEDVIIVDSSDGYLSSTSKLKLKVEWALRQGFDFIFCCFPDTYACASRLSACDYKNWDYFGCVFQHPGGSPYCQGGCGWFMNRKAMQLIIDESNSYPNDDCFVGDVLNRPEIRRKHCDSFVYVGEGPLPTNSVITSHLSTRKEVFTVQSMIDEHNKCKGIT